MPLLLLRIGINLTTVNTANYVRIECYASFENWFSRDLRYIRPYHRALFLYNHGLQKDKDYF